jgi:hypothetical protein
LAVTGAGYGQQAGLPMDVRYAQFLILLGEVCAEAELAGLWIEVQTITGARIGGVPRAGPLNHATVEVGDPDYGHSICIDTVEIPLQDIVSFAVSAPGELRAL